MKKLFACALLTAAVSLLPAPKASAGVPACADYCPLGEFNRICQDPNGFRITCWEYLYGHWGPPEA